MSLSAVMNAAGEVPMQVSRSRRGSSRLSEWNHGNNGVEEESEEMVVTGMILPFQALSISFEDVSYYVDMPAVSFVPRPS